jgi:hypothetical protein
MDPAVTKMLQFLRNHPQVRSRIPAPPNKTVVYSGAFERGSDMFRAWRMLAQAKAADPVKYDYVTLEERLRMFHVVDFGESLFDHANRLTAELEVRGRAAEAIYIWRALSGVYVQGASGKVRALILPGNGIGQSVFNMTEVNVLLRPDVLRQISIDPNALRDFRTYVRSGLTPAPIVVF